MLLSSTIGKHILGNNIFGTLPVCIIVVINIHSLYSHFHYTMRFKRPFITKKKKKTLELRGYHLQFHALLFVSKSRYIFLFSRLGTRTLCPIPLSIPSLLFLKRK